MRAFVHQSECHGKAQKCALIQHFCARNDRWAAGQLAVPMIRFIQHLISRTSVPFYSILPSGGLNPDSMRMLAASHLNLTATVTRARGGAATTQRGALQASG